jgi:acyl dehydratase
MPIAYPDILALKTEGQRFTWSERDSMLSALGVGAGQDPLEEAELRFVYEKGLRALPSLATAVSFAPGPLAQVAVDFAMIVHGDQQAIFHKPFPASGELTCDTRFANVWDRGPKGAVLQIESTLKDAAGDKLATLTAGIFARGDGGFGGPSEGMPEPHPIPERAPDVSLDFATRPEQALLYRLSGDRNPLHADPGLAKAVGFPRPILHGLCTYGVCCRAVLKAFCDYDPARLHSQDARFSAPVFPGETITVDLWRDGEEVSYQARVKDRDVMVVKNGRSLIG